MSHSKNAVRIASAVMALFLFAPFAKAQKIYWGDTTNNRIGRANIDGSNVETLLTGCSLRAPGAITIHAGMMYWIGDGKLSRAELDGSHVHVLWEGPANGYSSSIAIDPKEQRVYWVSGSTIRRMAIDGGEAEEIVPGAPSPSYRIGLALDLTGRKIYWTDRDLGRIERANFDGSMIETVFPSQSPSALGLDPVDGKLYWIAAGGLFRADLDGTDIETIIEDVYPPALIVDAARRKIIFTSLGIVRADLDGSNVETIVPYNYYGSVRGIAIEPQSGVIYWSDWGENFIRRVDSDGSDARDVLRLDLVPQALTLDLPRGKLIWIDHDRWRIRQANLDGTGVVDLIREPGGAWDLAIDPIGQRLFWTDYGGAILRGNLDGSGVEMLLYPTHPGEIGLYLPSCTLVWIAHHGVRYLRTSDCDGMGGANFPYWVQYGGHVAVDDVEAKVYWSEGSVIRRANLDGSNREDVLPSIGYSNDIAVDPYRKRLFWTYQGIHYAELDAPDLMYTVPGNVTSPGPIALDLRAPGDFNLDQLVDLKDFARFQNCFAGADAKYSDPACFFFDTDPADRDVDGDDFVSFAHSFGGH